MQTVMMPPWWEDLLKGYVKKTFFADTRKKAFAGRGEFTEGDYRFFAKGVRELNVAFTQERHAIPGNYLNQKELRSGYILYFLPVNALKVATLLFQNDVCGAIQCAVANERPLTILDIGSGPGTGMLGVMALVEDFLKGKKGGSLKLHFILIDQNKQALNDAAGLFESALEYLKKRNFSWKIEAGLVKIVANLFSERLTQVLAREEADIVLALNFLSELPQRKRLPIVEALVRDYLHPQGRLLIMEPALRLTTRELMELHDEMVDRRSALVLSPCLHQEFCPMLKANHRDWCHTYIPWERPAWIDKIDYLVGIRKDYLKCSYLLIGKEPPTMEKEKSVEELSAGIKGSLWRVVSGPLNSKGKSERLLCGPAQPQELLRVTRLDRDQSPANRDFDDLERGDLVIAPKIPRIQRETRIEKLK